MADQSYTKLLFREKHIDAGLRLSIIGQHDSILTQREAVKETAFSPAELTCQLFEGATPGPPATGEWWAEARVHNVDDPYGVFSDWHPIQLTVNPTAEYLPIKAQFAVGVPVAYPLEGTGACTLSGVPAWVEVATVPNGCVVMGRAPVSGEYYEFTMTDFRETGCPGIEIVFSGNVFGEYGFVPLPEGAGISGLAWHQVEKYADPSTEPPS